MTKPYRHRWWHQRCSKSHAGLVIRIRLPCVYIDREQPMLQIRRGASLCAEPVEVVVNLLVILASAARCVPAGKSMLAGVGPPRHPSCRMSPTRTVTTAGPVCPQTPLPTRLPPACLKTSLTCRLAPLGAETSYNPAIYAAGSSRSPARMDRFDDRGDGLTRLVTSHALRYEKLTA